MNEDLIEELLKLLKPALRSQTKARRLLERYWADKGVILWSTEDLHRAANERSLVLTEAAAKELLTELITRHNAQYGLRWSDLTEAIEQSGLSRDIKKRELHRFLSKDVLTIDPPRKGTS